MIITVAYAKQNGFYEKAPSLFPLHLEKIDPSLSAPSGKEKFNLVKSIVTFAMVRQGLVDNWEYLNQEVCMKRYIQTGNEDYLTKGCYDRMVAIRKGLDLANLSTNLLLSQRNVRFIEE